MSCYIRLRGLPWSVTHLEILAFLKNINVVNGTKGIHMVLSRWDGKNTGEAFVELSSLYDEKEAFKLNKMTLGHRYIEIFSATKEEVQHALKNPGSTSSNVVKLRGLPYVITEDMIDEFFNGLNIKRSREGTVIVMDRRGRATGEAYVQFETLDDTEQALLRNRAKIGHRYIEIFRSSLAEMRRQSGSRPGPYDIKDRSALRNRDDFGNINMTLNRDSGLFNNNKSGFGDIIIKPIGLSSPGNGLNQNGFGIHGGFKTDSCDNKFGKSMHNNNFGTGVNSNIGCNNREEYFNAGLIWNNDINRNMRGSNTEIGQNFENNIGFNYGNDGNKLNNIYERENNGAVNIAAMMVNKANSEQPMNTIGIDRNFRIELDQFCIHMRGLPYNTFEKDVVKFFEPIRPSNVQIIFNNKGMHSGTADAYFNLYEDSQNAMQKHMEQIGSRYIELFFDGKTNGNKCSFGRKKQNL